MDRDAHGEVVDAQSNSRFARPGLQVPSGTAAFPGRWSYRGLESLGALELTGHARRRQPAEAPFCRLRPPSQTGQPSGSFHCYYYQCCAITAVPACLGNLQLHLCRTARSSKPSTTQLRNPPASGPSLSRTKNCGVSNSFSALAPCTTNLRLEFWLPIFLGLLTRGHSAHHSNRYAATVSGARPID